MIAKGPGRKFVELSAITAGVKDVRRVMDQALTARDLYRTTTVLFLDEIHRFNKAQQDALLPGVENRWVVLVAATTENPSFSVVSPLLSRSLLLTLKPLTDADVEGLLQRAVDGCPRTERQGRTQRDALAHLVRLSGGDARRALTALEAAAGVAFGDGDDVEGAGTAAAVPRSTQAHGAGPGCRLRSLRPRRGPALRRRQRVHQVHPGLGRRRRAALPGTDDRGGGGSAVRGPPIVISAAEDVGMADPTALQTAVAAAQAVQLIGMPEGRIILAEAVVHLATAPKSNAAYMGINQAIADVRAGLGNGIPAHLRDAHYPGSKQFGHGAGYKYAHDAPHAVATQQYPPDDLVGRNYYQPTANGAERDIATRLERLRKIIRGQ